MAMDGHFMLVPKSSQAPQEPMIKYQTLQMQFTYLQPGMKNGFGLQGS